MMKKILSLMLTIIFVVPLDTANVLAYDSKIMSTSEIYASWSKLIVPATDIYNGSKYDKDVSKWIKKLVYTSKDDNTWNSNYKLDNWDNWIISTDGSIWIFSPWVWYYAPYVPLEFQVNIPVWYEQGGKFFNIADSEKTKLRIPTQFTNNKTASEILVYWLDQKWEGLLWFDVYNSNKANLIANTDANKGKDISFLPKWSNLDLSWDTKNYASFYKNTANEWYFVRWTDNENSAYTLLWHANYGVNNGDTDGDWFVGNWFFSMASWFKVASDLFVWNSQSTNNIYKKGWWAVVSSPNISGLNSIPEIYTSNSFKNSSGSTMSVDWPDSDIIDYNQIFDAALNSEDDFKLSNSLTTGLLYRIFSYGGPNSWAKKSDGFKLNIWESSATSVSCADANSHSFEFYKSCLTNIWSYGLKFFALDVDSNGNISQFVQDSNIKKDGTESMIPDDIYVKGENNEILYKIGIPVISSDNESNLSSYFKTLDIGNAVKFKSYKDWKLRIYVPYILANKANINGKLELQNNMLFRKSYTFKDAILKLDSRDITKVDSLTNDIKRLTSGYQTGWVIEFEKSFSDGSKYSMSNYWNGWTEETKFISFNPNIIPFNLFLKDSENTLNAAWNMVAWGKVVSLDFSNDNTSDWVNSSTDPDRRFSLNALYKWTPVSKSYIRKVWDKTYYYKVFVIQMKANGDVSLWSNENQNLFLWTINAGIGFHTDPYLVDPVEWAFLSVSTRKDSIGFPIHWFQAAKIGAWKWEAVRANIFTQDNKTVLRFNEVDWDNDKMDSNSVPGTITKWYDVTIKDLDSWVTYMNLSTKDWDPTPVTPQERLKVLDQNNVTIKTPTCIDGYEIYDDYKKFYKALYESFEMTDMNPYTEVNKTLSWSTTKIPEYIRSNLLYLLNTSGINRSDDMDAMTTYFNYPKPFCVNKEWAKNWVQNLSEFDLAVMLKYYLVGITDTELQNFNESNLSILKDPSLKASTKYDANYLLWIQESSSGWVLPLYWGKEWYINPINIDQFKSSEKLWWINAGEYKNYLSGKSGIFYEQYVLPSFKKLFITDRLIPEQYKLMWVWSSQFTSSNNVLGYDPTNSYLASKFKFWFSDQVGKYPIKENQFVLNLLSWENKKFFPIIWANIVVARQWPDWINYCNNWNKYYLDGACYDANSWLEMEITDPADIPKNKDGVVVKKGGAIYDFTKVGRITWDATPIPLTSGTTYYDGYGNVHWVNPATPSETKWFDVLNSAKKIDATSLSSWDANSVILNYWRNLGWNLYSLLQLDRTNKSELGFFANDTINDDWVGSNPEGLITLSGSTKLAAYPFISPLPESTKLSDIFWNGKIGNNIIKVPFHILRNKETSFSWFTNIGESAIIDDTTVDKVYNTALLTYYLSTVPVEDIFEKRNWEYWMYVNIDNKTSSESIDQPSGLSKNNNDNLGSSKILTVEYSPEFALGYNGIQLSVAHEDFDNFCSSKDSSLWTDIYKCLLTYNNNLQWKLYMVDAVQEKEKPVDLASCITNPEMESCKATEVKKVKTPLSDQFTFNQVNSKSYITDTVFSIGNDKYVWNALKLVSSDSTKKYIPEFWSTNSLKESNWILARKNFEIAKTTDGSIGQINDFIYNNGSVEDKLQNTMNYNSLYNDDSIIVTNGRQYYTWATNVVWGYINTAGRIDNSYGAILNDYTYSDNDNLLEDNWFGVNNFAWWIDTTQGRRNLIRNEVASGNHAYVTLAKIPKDSVNSINWILRIAKDSRKYFSNMTIQLPENDALTSQSKLLNEVNPTESIYSYNNLTITYGWKAYTWWNNDTSCNGINPNAVYDRIDKFNYDNSKRSWENSTRSDTITICLKDSGNSSGLTSSGNTLTSDLEVKLPLKPTKNYAKYKPLSGNEQDIASFIGAMNSSSRNMYWYAYSDSTVGSILWTSNPEQRYYVGKINYSNSSISFMSSPAISPSNIQIQAGINWGSCGCSWKKCTPPPRYSGWYVVNQNPISFENNLLNWDTQLKSIPQIYLNGFTINSVWVVWSNKFTVGSYIKTAKTYTSTYSTAWNKSWNVGWFCWANYSYVSNEIRNRAFAQSFKNTFSLSHPAISEDLQLSGYDVNFTQIPKYDTAKYTQEVKVTNKILDSYKKTGNLQTPIFGNITNNPENYITQSLKENSYKVAIGDIMTYKIDVDTNSLSSVPLQNFYVSQTVDRGLDIIPDSLKVEGTNLGQKVLSKPIYNNDADFKALLKSDTNTDFRIANTSAWTKTNYLLNSAPTEISLSNVGDELVVKKWVLFLQLLDGGGGNLTSNTTIRYIRNWKNSMNEDNVNGLYQNSADLDILEWWASRNVAWDIIIVKAGENLVRNNTDWVSTAPRFKILHTNRLTDSLLKYDVSAFENANIDSSANVFGVDPISSGLSTTKITPKYKQNVFFYNSNGWVCPTNDDFVTSSGALTFTGVAWTYCFAPNKYMDYVYKGYLQLSSPYNRLIGPDVSNPFIMGWYNWMLDIYKNIWGTKNYNLLRDTDRNTDKEKMLLVNLWTLAKWDKVTLTFDVKVNKYNDINHKLFDYSKLDSNGYSDSATDLVRNDIIMNNSAYDNTNSPKIYTHAKNTKVFYINHIGEEKVIYDSALTLWDWSDTNSLMVVPKTTLSLVNLSWRKNYYVCDPDYSTVGSCKKMTTLDTYDKYENTDSNWRVLSFDNWTRFPETNVPLYKGQKFLLRVAIDNPYYDLSDIKNKLASAKLHIWYNSNFLIFDDVAYVWNGASSSDVWSISFGQSDKNSTVNNSVNAKFKSLLETRSSRNWNTWKETLVKSVWEDYKEIEYSLDSNKINNGQVLVDFLFTVKYTEDTKNIDKAYLDAFNQKILSNFVSTLEYSVQNPSEEMFANTEQNVNAAKADPVNKYLTYNTAGNVNNNTLGNVNYLYYSVPFSKDFSVDDGTNKTSKTDFNPDSWKLKVRYFDANDNASWMNAWNAGIAIELLNSKDSSSYTTEDAVGDFSVTLPYGFTTQSVKWYRIVDIDAFNTKLAEDTYISAYDTTKIAYRTTDKLNKTILTLHPEGLKLRPGRRYTVYIYLNADVSKVDPYSTFTVQTSIGNNYLFWDVQTSYKSQDVFDTLVKTLPTFAENDVFYGNSYIKNNVGSDSYINQNSWDSDYYIIWENWLPIKYSSSKLKDIKYIDSGNKPKLIIDTPTILNESKNSFSVVKLGNWLIQPNEWTKTYTFQNNTVYYFDWDINIGDPAVNSWDYKIKVSDNLAKQKWGWVTIIANGRIFVNTNIKLDNSWDKNMNLIPNVWFIWLKWTAFNPRVTIVEGYFYSPITSNSVVDPASWSANYSEWVISTWYANDSLKFNGAISWGTVFNERTQWCGVDSTDPNCTSNNWLSKNQVENFQFNNLLYLNPPPVFRK